MKLRLRVRHYSLYTRTLIIMPWQAAPPLLIIFGAFNVASGLIWAVDRGYYGKVRPFISVPPKLM